MEDNQYDIYNLKNVAEIEGVNKYNKIILLKKIVIEDKGKLLVQGMFKDEKNNIDFHIDIEGVKIYEKEVINFFIIRKNKDGKFKYKRDYNNGNLKSMCKEDILNGYILLEKIENNKRNIVIYRNANKFDVIYDIEGGYLFFPLGEEKIIFCQKKDSEMGYYIYSIPNKETMYLGKSSISNPLVLIRDYRINKYANKKISIHDIPQLEIEKDGEIYFFINNSSNSKWFKIVELFCKKNKIFMKCVENQFNDDNSENYIIKIDKNKIFEIIFLDYCCENHLYGWRIYNQDMNTVLEALNYNLIDNTELNNVEEYLLSEKLYNYTSESSQHQTYKNIYDLIQKNFQEKLTLENCIKKIFKLENSFSNCRDNIEKYILSCGIYNLSFNHLQSEKQFDKQLLEKCLITRSNLFDELVSKDKSLIKWKSEYKLYLLVKKYFNDTIFQYSIVWLYPQSLDIYIPSLKIGIEYQGEQHYNKIEFFVDESFQERQELDIVKKGKCKENGIQLIEWKYDEEITDENLKKKFNQLGIEIDIYDYQTNLFDL